MLKRLKDIPAISRLVSDKMHRAHIALKVSAAFDIGFGALTLSSGVLYGSWWSIAVGIYYAAMVVMMLMLEMGIRRTSRIEDGYQRTLMELRVYRNSAWTLLLLNVALTGVAFQMVNQGMSWTYPEHVIYGVAAFTFGTLGVAVAGVIRGKPDDPYTEQAVRSVNLAKGFVGMFILTAALIVEFGGYNPTFRFLMESAVGTVCMSAIIIIALFMLVRAYKARRELEVEGR